MNHPAPDPDELLGGSLSPGRLPAPQESLELLAQAQAGDAGALGELIGRYQGRLRRIVRIQLRDPALRRECDSMDVVQSTLRAALPKLQDLRPRTPAGLLQWLAVIALNQIRDAHERRHAIKRDAGREVALDDGAPSRLACEGPQPEEQALLGEVRELLDEEVARLPEDQRQVVLLRDYFGEDWERIAVELGRQKGAARQLHQRAWVHLRSALRPRLMGERGGETRAGEPSDGSDPVGG